MKIRSFLASAVAACLLACAAVAAHAQADPPSRVARLNYFTGNVTFAPAGTDNWIYANLNRPMTTGDSVWTDQGARAEMHVGSTALRMNGQTSLSLLSVSDTNVQLKVTQGTLNVRLREYDPGQPYEIDTPNLAFVPQRAGEYRIDVDPSGTTRVTVWRGAGAVYGDQASLSIGEGQQVQFSGTDLAQVGGTEAPAPDAFDAWAGTRDRRDDNSVSARYVSRDMTGYESLDDYGTWQEVPDYGTVWVPTVVAVGWAPYRTGHWAWIAPWGWTWVDDEPWGFAPFHYGRWAYVSERWCWVPGPVAVRPVYAPALVAWVGGAGGGVNWSVSISSGGPGVAWFPLGPGEAYRPAYYASPRYITNVNKTVIVNKTVNVNNTTIINNNITKTVYVNQHVRNAITAVPASAFVQGRPVAQVATALRPDAVNHMRVAAAPGVAPVAQSLVGGARMASRVPPASTFARQVVATRAPAPIAQPSRQLMENLHPVPNAGGRPLTPNSAAAVRVPSRADNVKLLSNVPSHPAPAPAVNERAQAMPGRPGAPGEAGTPGANRTERATPPAMQERLERAPQRLESNVPHPPQAPHGNPATGFVPGQAGGRTEGVIPQPGHANAERAMHENRPAPQAQPERRAQPQFESRGQPQPQPQVRPQPQPQVPQVQPERRAQPQPQFESRGGPQPQPQVRQPPQPRPQENRPAPVPHPAQPREPRPQGEPPHEPQAQRAPQPHPAVPQEAPHLARQQAEHRGDEHPRHAND